MTISKDESIVGQVAAKIAADLTTTAATTNTPIAEVLVQFALAFDAVNDELRRFHGWNGSNSELIAAAEAVTKAFNTPSSDDQFQPQQRPTITSGFRIAGKQHGPIPDWLAAAAAEAGVTEVWDNRDKIDGNSKRPWFKAVNGDKAFWPPRGR